MFLFNLNEEAVRKRTSLHMLKNRETGPVKGWTKARPSRGTPTQEEQVLFKVDWRSHKRFQKISLGRFFGRNSCRHTRESIYQIYLRNHFWSVELIRNWKTKIRKKSHLSKFGKIHTYKYSRKLGILIETTF